MDSRSDTFDKCAFFIYVSMAGHEAALASLRCRASLSAEPEASRSRNEADLLEAARRSRDAEMPPQWQTLASVARRHCAGLGAAVVDHGVESPNVFRIIHLMMSALRPSILRKWAAVSAVVEADTLRAEAETAQVQHDAEVQRANSSDRALLAAFLSGYEDFLHTSGKSSAPMPVLA